MSALANSTVYVAALLLAGAPCRAQLGATRQQVAERYGSCKPETVDKPRGPNVYDGVIDVGTHCYFSDGRFRVMALFKSDRVVGFYFTKPPTFWESLLHPFAYSYLPLSDTEISALLHSAAPSAEWLAAHGDEIIRRWHTSDGSAAAYYFASGHRDLYHLVIQTAAVDEVFRRVEHY